MTAAVPYLAPEKYCRFFGMNEQIGQLFDFFRGTHDFGRTTVMTGSRNGAAFELDAFIENVSWHFKINRTGHFTCRFSTSHGYHIGHAFGRFHAACPFCDRRHQLDVIVFL